MPITSIAWIAGIFEGEGCLYRRTHPKANWTVQLRMTDEDIVHRFANFFNCGSPVRIETAPSKQKNKPVFRWICNKKEDVISVITQMLPYLGDRRAGKVFDCLEDYDYQWVLNEQRTA